MADQPDAPAYFVYDGVLTRGNVQRWMRRWRAS